ncbi:MULTISPECIES: hypothetical protein, partial [Enterobacterales]|uniref:hypothetical protein n=1 Tax=Enterobacterales TaxID=91347 RepID=UPI002EDA5FCD
YWSTTLGSVTPATSVTGADGKATSTLTDSGDPGTTQVTASLDNGSQMTTTITVNLFQVYFITGAPALSELNSDESYSTHNTISVYGNTGDTLTMTVGDSAIIVDSGSNTYTTVINAVPMSFSVKDNDVESVPASVTVNQSYTANGTLDFSAFPFTDSLRLVVTSNAKADGIDVNRIYFDSEDITSPSVTVTLSGSAVFKGTSLQSQVFNLSAAPYDLTCKIVDPVAETVEVTCAIAEHWLITRNSTFKP